MNLKRLFFAIVAFVALSATVVAQQPYSGCWHPDFIRDWTPEKDPDVKFNRSTVPLQPRFKDVTVKANEHQYYDGLISACLTMHPMCSQVPAQGAANFIGYNPTYWQYMDVLVWWGGSAGEGIILPPSAPVTDVAHMNGVRVLGQIFFPPTAFGGQPEWTDQILTQENGVYPYAIKLYEIAKFYGFDGWFINCETKGTDINKWTGFYESYIAEAAKDEVIHELQFYDMGTTLSGKEKFVSLPGGSMFLNYGSPSEANINNQTNILKGAPYNLSQEQIFEKLYFGVEVAQGGLSGNASYFQRLFPKTGHKGSIDLFNPEEHAWKKEVEALLNTSENVGEKAYAATAKVFQNESRYWTNRQGDPTNLTDRDNATLWPGFANAAMERTTIQEKPFVTSFSSGMGKYRFVNGDKKGTGDWYHRGMQNIMPTWRWWIEGGVTNDIKHLNIDINWDDAYNFGTSLKVSGKLAAGQDNLVRLYKTKLAIASGDKFRLVYKSATANAIGVKLGVTEDDNAFTTLATPTTTVVNGWTVAEYDLSSLNGKTVSIIALNFMSATEVASYEALLGELGVIGSGYAPAQPQVTNLLVQNELKETEGEVRLVWDAPASIDDVDHFNVYLTRNGQKTLVGQTRNEGFYVPKFARVNTQEMSIDLSVTTVTKDMKEGSEVRVSVDYPALRLPDVSITASKTLVKFGEEVTLTARANNAPTAYAWELPEDATLVSSSENKAVVKFSTKGLKAVKVKVTNPVGVSEKVVEGLVEVSNTKEIDIVSVGATIIERSGELPPEVAEWLVDGVKIPGSTRNKWCDGGKNEHFVVLDLKEEKSIYRFQWYDCGNKENESDNMTKYKIWVSADNVTWTQVVDEVNRPENVKNDWVMPTKGRYVKFMPYNDEVKVTIRIWEFEVYGKGTNILSLEKPEDQELPYGGITKQSISWSLEDMDEAPNFSLTAVSDNNDVIEVKNIEVDKATGKLNFDLDIKKSGIAQITMTLTNGEFTQTSTYKITAVDPTIINLALGKTISIISNDIFDPDESEFNVGESGINDGDRNTYWLSGWDSGDTFEHSATLDLQQKSYIKKIVVVFKPDGEFYRQPGRLKVFVSDSPSDGFEEVYHKDMRGIEEENVIPLARPARYVRVEGKGLASYGFALCEVEIYGKGEESINYVLLSTPDDVKNMATSGLEKSYKLAADIDMTGVEGLAPIGTQELPFTGILDGDGYRIKGMAITGSNDIAMFGVTKNAFIQNIEFNDFMMRADKADAAVVVGTAMGTYFSNVAVTGFSTTSIGNAHAQDHAGALAGNMKAGSGTNRVENCYSETFVKGYNYQAGGIAGVGGDIQIVNSYVAGKVQTQANGWNSAGAAVSIAEGNVSLKGFVAVPTAIIGKPLGRYVAGLNANVSVTFTDSRYASDMTFTAANQTAASLIPNVDNARTFAEMKTAAQYTSIGWDFDNTWEIKEGTAYPTLKVIRSTNGTTGLDNIERTALTIYPNPAQSSGVVMVTTPNEGVITITNINGNTVKQVMAQGERTSISLDGLAAGVYFVSVDNAIAKLIVR